MDDNEATHEVDATEKNIREGYVEEIQEGSQEEFLSPPFDYKMFSVFLLER